MSCRVRASRSRSRRTRATTVVLAQTRWRHEDGKVAQQKTDDPVDALTVDHAFTGGDGVARELGPRPDLRGHPPRCGRRRVDRLGLLVLGPGGAAAVSDQLVVADPS